ncbi:MAG TPA: HAMP domain-containing sensor histidine kinase, partial [Polyangiaceae bacterium]|nr:HAMP domain-containing sensor histidine kinase [Polyangiaceae bacterium]
MKVIPKLTLALVGGTCAVLAVNGYLRVQRERTYFEADRLRDRELLGRSLSATAAAIWESDGQDAAARTIEAVNTPFAAIHVQWLASDALALKHDAGTVFPIGVIRALTRTERGYSGLVWKTDVPLEVDGVFRGVIELSEPVTAERRFVRRAIEDTAVLATALALVSALLSFAMSQWLVGGPVRVLAEKARQVGRGQFSGTVVLLRRDELGDLAREMNAMADRLAATMHQLRHADRLATVGTLASGVAHELGTPLNVVSARATMIATGEANPEESKDYARVIARAADRMIGTIRRLLQFARREGLQKANCDMRALVRESLDLLQPLARKRSVTLELVADDDTRANVDAGQIQQAIANLVMNAIQ